MASIAEVPRRSPFDNDRHMDVRRTRDIPVLASAAPSTTYPYGEPMTVSPDMTASREAQATGSPTSDRHGAGSATPSDREGHANGTNGPAAGGAAGQGPKVVQTAFIHKLYSMLEDQSITHLISWSTTNESFVMSPSTEFSKVLASYFKHTNISSFVRQLNMYGFHKVSDVFHTGSPDHPLWEFKHGGGSFKRGDLVGLRDIKRRASRHALIHRDSFSNPPPPPPKMSVQLPLPPPPTATILESSSQDPVDARLTMIECNFHELYSRLARTEDAYLSLASKCQLLSEGLVRCHQWSTELSSQLLCIVPDPESQIYRDVFALRTEIGRQSDSLRAQESVNETRLQVTTSHQSYDPVAPLSPRQQGYDTSRRPSLQVTSRANSFRAPMPPHLASPRRPGSLSVTNGQASPSSIRPPPNYNTLPPPPVPQAQPQPQHPLAAGSSPPANLSRRHTSADIRLQGWQGGIPPPLPPVHSPYISGQNSSQWPSSPYRNPAQTGDQQLRDALAQYELPRASNQPYGVRQTTPPPDNGPPSYANVGNEAGWQLPGPKFPFKNIDFSAPPTRRSSMASNVHSLLNPAETAEREGEDEPPEERKRKRLV